MIKLSNSHLLRIITRLFILLAIAKTISLFVWWILPSDGVELQIQDDYKPKYRRIDFNNMLDTTANKATVVATVNTGISITNMVLKGLYGKGSNGFAIVALKATAQKTSIISAGEEFSGYTLKTILSDRVVFTKADKEYVLKMENAKMLATAGVVSPVLDNTKSVSRNDIMEYAQNPKQIWRDISIQEVKNGKKIEGFKVTRIQENSKMAELGLQKGDVIIKVNNRVLKSYKDAIDIYAKIGTLEAVQIVVKRNNQEVELVYEIN